MAGLRAMSPRRLGPGPALALILAGAVGGCRDEGLPPRAATEVGAEAVRVRPVATDIVLTGDVMARVTSELSFRVGGRVVERRAEVGDRVAADQVLATLDPREQRANLEAAAAGVQAAEAQLSQAASTNERQKTLIRQGYTTRREADAAEEAFRAAQGALDVARAALGTAQDQLGQTELKPGTAGIITARNVEAGQVVQAAQSVFTLAQDGPRDAVFSVYESLLAGEPGDDTIRIALVSDPSVTATARIREVSPTVDPANGTVRVKFEILDPPARMTLGSSVVGTGRLQAKPAAVLPWSALSSAGGRPAVWVVDPADGTVALRPVTVAGYEVGRLLVRDGLADGQVVVTRGGQLLHPGERVNVATGRAP